MSKNIVEVIVKKGWVVAKEPDKILRRKIPDHRGDKNYWELFINGNKESRKIVADQGWGLDLPAYTFAVFWNGWLAGIFNPVGGEFVAHKEGANEENFIKSIENWRN